jgi:adenylyl-sulfate kinase
VAVSPNVQWELGEVTRRLREERNGHPALVVWLTGYSASGKSTLARAAEQKLFDEGAAVARLDGDNVRHGLCGDLGFSEEDRNENIRRVAEVAAILYELGNIVICAFISPFRAEREFARRLVPEGRFLEVHVSCGLDECRRRDPKGLYAKAERGEIRSFTGVDSAYEEPEKPELTIDTEKLSLEESVDALVAAIRNAQASPAAPAPANDAAAPPTQPGAY